MLRTWEQWLTFLELFKMEKKYEIFILIKENDCNGDEISLYQWGEIII